MRRAASPDAMSAPPGGVSKRLYDSPEHAHADSMAGAFSAIAEVFEKIAEAEAE